MVGLILLVALTLLALASMNTASLDLIMAGNEQYRSRAFAAAEAGLERGFNTGVFSTAGASPEVSANTGTNDTYRYTISPLFNGVGQTPPPGNSTGSFQAVYFDIQSTGDSARGATTTHNQEVMQVIQKTDDATYDESKCAGSAALTADRSGCGP